MSPNKSGGKKSTQKMYGYNEDTYVKSFCENVCANTVEDVKAIAKMSPNLIVAEPTDLIGTGQTSDSNYVLDTIKTVNEINPDIMVLQGAGISNGEDVYNTIKLGAQATGSTSGIIKAADPYAMVEEMIYNLRKAWDELH